jgi:hypothetical protein
MRWTSLERTRVLKALQECSCGRNIESAIFSSMSLGQQLTDDLKRQQSGDNLRAILHHSGVLSSPLDRFEEASSKMWQLEWKLLKRDAAHEAAGIAHVSYPAGD